MHESEPTNTPRRKGPRRKEPRKATGRHLENAALHYLQRFASSTENFRRVMMRKVERSARIHGTDRAEGAATIEELIRRFSGAGLLDDSVYAAGKALSLFRRGASPRAIRAALWAKGVDEDAIGAALASLADEAAEPALAAACTLARRRRLGPYRPAPGREERRDQDLAVLARAGFSYDVARTVVDAVSPELLRERLADGAR